ncbi:MAG: hypothetical protein Q7S70_02735 [bacterium]|nr:hypothetical protein [bacterium]
MKRKKNGSVCSGEKRVTCRKCSEKFTIKLGTKNSGYLIRVNCPKCGTPNVIKITGKNTGLMHAFATIL